ncbi:hypothetical protein K7X08_034051 [Anisodus acutangulus]|uniref:Uncharacterized protein n=1 Tax=Anisodus acutangulus TaxID=402998 RepID=A0A9Q1RIM8_9SOLA|nr:hypothetical protein K7X08_034051 [Anisodus acutangulus]
MLEGGGGDDDKVDDSGQCDSGGGLKSNGGGGDEQITGHVAQSLMQSKFAAGGMASFGSWEFTLEIITIRRKQKDQLITLMDGKEKLVDAN